MTKLRDILPEIPEGEPFEPVMFCHPDMLDEDFEPTPITFIATKRSNIAGEFIEFTTGREAISLLDRSGLVLSQAVSRALYDPGSTWDDIADRIFGWRYSATL